VKRTTPAVTVVPAPGGDGERDSSAAGDHAGRCDLRGLRVDEALDRLLYALDRAAGAGRGTLLIVHGLGTGALCDAVRRYLAESAYIASFAPGSPEEGGDGVTLAQLAE
jgi:DNA mismatch repair protein MutS2